MTHSFAKNGNLLAALVIEAMPPAVEWQTRASGTRRRYHEPMFDLEIHHNGAILPVRIGKHTGQVRIMCNGETLAWLEPAAWRTFLFDALKQQAAKGVLPWSVPSRRKRRGPYLILPVIAGDTLTHAKFWRDTGDCRDAKGRLIAHFDPSELGFISH